MSATNRIAQSVLRSPLLWGALATLGFYTLIHGGVLDGEIFHRYFAGHWVEYVTTAMFFVGVSHLLIKGTDLIDQRGRLKQSPFEAIVPLPRAADEAHVLLEELAKLPAYDQGGYFPLRLREALASVLRKGGVDGLDEELKYLADMDRHRSHASYALVRMITWAIPILGFLGTVIGITMAIARLSPDALENSLPAVTSGLGVAFDTTALALALSMALMFAQFAVDRLDGRLLSDVDSRIAQELMARFGSLGSSADPQLGAVRRMAETVVQAAERMVQRQAEVWHSTIDAAHDRWNQLTTQSQSQLETALSSSLVNGLDAYAQRLTIAEEQARDRARGEWLKLHEGLSTGAEQQFQRLLSAEESALEKTRRQWEQAQQSFQSRLETVVDRLLAGEEHSADQNRKHWEQVSLALNAASDRVGQALTTTAETVQRSLSEQAESARQQQAELTRQAALLREVVDATGQLNRLEDSLNRNLTAVAGAQNLEDTLLNLTAAVNILTARLGQVAPAAPVNFRDTATNTKSKAA